MPQNGISEAFLSSKSTHLNFSLDLLIRLFRYCTWEEALKTRLKRLFWIFEENCCYVQDRENGAILGPRPILFNCSLNLLIRFFWNQNWWQGLAKNCFGFGRKIHIMKANESSVGVRGPLLLRTCYFLISFSW